MPIITGIEKQKKEGRYNIYLDGDFAFGLYKETIYDYGLRVNDNLTETKINEIREKDEIGFGNKVAIKFLNYKSRSEKEVRRKLKEKKLSAVSIDKIISRLKEFKFLDDEQYAKMFVESKLIHNPKGRRALSIKLAEKGIPKDTVQSTIEENYSEETEIKKAQEVLKKYQKKSHKGSPQEIKQKCFRHLLSKGFDFDIVKKVLKISEGE